jgi:hypothetical protein
VRQPTLSTQSRQQMLGKMEAEIAGRADDKNLRRIARKLFRFLWKWTQAIDRALRTLWLIGHAHSSAMVLHKMAEANPSFFRHDFCEVGFDFVRIGFFGEA